MQNLNTWLESAYQRSQRNSIFDEMKQSSILDPFDLNMDQFENGWALSPKNNQSQSPYFGMEPCVIIS